ncbi:hypothetical protein [Haladaptatus sp. R4]|uniref:hypothetical protein n=1 Tax=Haladaptatus sp. R4 TaxID=1679489 RepID=UPI000B2A37F2|nr:hypothetical protein [Haladaptatus sp. R4]
MSRLEGETDRMKFLPIEREIVTSEHEDEGLRDAFQLLANETRLEILYALWNAPGWTAT